MSAPASVLIGGGNRYTNNPKHLSAISIAKALVYVKSAQTTNQNLGAAAGFTALALRGNQVSVATADTYVTVTDQTGAGFLFNLISPTHDSATFTATFRVTVDGIVYTLAYTTQTIGNRVVLGPITQGVPAVSTVGTIGTDIIGPNTSTDAGFQTASVGGVTTQVTTGIGIPTPEMILSNNWQCLRFESSLKVEMKTSVLSATAVDKQCAATFRMDV